MLRTQLAASWATRLLFKTGLFTKNGNNINKFGFYSGLIYKNPNANTWWYSSLSKPFESTLINSALMSENFANSESTGLQWAVKPDDFVGPGPITPNGWMWTTGVLMGYRNKGMNLYWGPRIGFSSGEVGALIEGGATFR